METHDILDDHMLDGIMADVERRFLERTEAEKARMRDEGLEPAERHDDWIHAGTPVFSAGVRTASPGRLQIRMSAHGRGDVEDGVDLVGAAWPRHPAETDADAFLDALAEFWPSIAAPYLSEDAHWPETSALRIPGVPPVEVERVDGWLEFSSPGGTVRPKSESVLVVETLRTIGDEIVRRELVSVESASRWSGASEATDLPSYPPDDWSGDPDETHLQIHRKVDGWFAMHFGMSPELWRLSAGLTAARHLLHWKAGRGSALGSEEWLPTWKADLPEADALVLIDEAAALDGKSREAFLDDAAHERSTTARGSAIFGRDRERRERMLAERRGPSTT